MNTAIRPVKKCTNISLAPALVEEAWCPNINHLPTLNSALERVVQEKRQARWREENHAAITAMNQFTE